MLSAIYPALLECLREGWVGWVGGGAQLIAVASGNGHVLYRIPLRRTGPAPFLIHHPSVEAKQQRVLPLLLLVVVALAVAAST